jgi:hypothetical protein
MNIAKSSITRPMKIEVSARSQTNALGSMKINTPPRTSKRPGISNRNPNVPIDG